MIALPSTRAYHLRMATLRALASLIVISLLSGFRASAAIPEPIRLDTGLVSGVAGAYADVRVFKGLPYAAPPVGELRWREPQPPAKWDGIRVAEAFSANCMQRAAGGGAFPPYGGDRSATRMSEDCLYLNVYTTAASARERRPVMVWIHGGAFTSGAGAIYEGEELARKGVIVVTINYRLGVFGFLSHPDLTRESASHASGNYAFQDQIAALRWVRKNISAFGGDPSRVTIFGESAGSWSVNYLMASPLARGLFQRAIGQSGGQFAPGRALAEAEQAGVRFAESQGASSVSALRMKAAEDLARANGFQSAANVDGWFLPQDVYTMFSSGKQNDVPLLIGSNADEGSIFTAATVTGRSFREQAQRRYGADADAFLKLYPFTTDEEARKAQAGSMRDQTFGWEMRTWARTQTRTGKSKVYLYYFSHVPPLENAAWLGAQHGAEIPYVFNWPNGKHSLQVAWTEADKTLAEQVSSYWVNFATAGDPNGKNLPKWPAYQTKDDQALEFGRSITVIPVPHKEALDFLDAFIERQRRTSAARPQTGR